MDILLKKITATIHFYEMKGTLQKAVHSLQVRGQNYQVSFEPIPVEEAIPNHFRALISIHSDQYRALDFDTALSLITKAGGEKYGVSINSLKDVRGA